MRLLSAAIFVSIVAGTATFTFAAFADSAVEAPPVVPTLVPVGDAPATSSTVVATTPASAPSAPPTVIVTLPTARPMTIQEASRAIDPHAYRHDGVYFRAGLGGGYVGSRQAIASSGGTTRYAGAGVGAEVAAGYTIGEVVVGGTIILQTATPAHGDRPGFVGSTISGQDLNLGVYAPFVEWYPMPDYGLHVGGFFGVSTLSLTYDSNDNDAGPSRVGAAIGADVGYDFWLGPIWSFGFAARLMGASFGGPIGSYPDTGGARVGAAQISATLLLN